MNIMARQAIPLLLTIGAMVIVFSMGTSPAMAASSADPLASCFADNTTEKQRKALARWVFAGMAAHPEIQSISQVSDEVRDTLDKEVAAMVTVLLAEDCLEPTKAAIKEGGNKALKSAFAVVGKLAFQELMVNPEVNAAFVQYIKYVDRRKFEALQEEEEEGKE